MLPTNPLAPQNGGALITVDADGDEATYEVAAIGHLLPPAGRVPRRDRRRRAVPHHRRRRRAQHGDHRRLLPRRRPRTAPDDCGVSCTSTGSCPQQSSASNCRAIGRRRSCRPSAGRLTRRGTAMIARSVAAVAVVRHGVGLERGARVGGSAVSGVTAGRRPPPAPTRPTKPCADGSPASTSIECLVKYPPLPVSSARSLGASRSSSDGANERQDAVAVERPAANVSPPVIVHRAVGSIAELALGDLNRDREARVEIEQRAVVDAQAGARQRARARRAASPATRRTPSGWSDTNGRRRRHPTTGTPNDRAARRRRGGRPTEHITTAPPWSTLRLEVISFGYGDATGRLRVGLGGDRVGRHGVVVSTHRGCWRRPRWPLPTARRSAGGDRRSFRRCDAGARSRPSRRSGRRRRSRAPARRVSPAACRHRRSRRARRRRARARTRCCVPGHGRGDGCAASRLRTRRRRRARRAGSWPRCRLTRS